MNVGVKGRVAILLDTIAYWNDGEISRSRRMLHECDPEEIYETSVR